MTFRCVEVPANVRVAYKIFPGNEFSIEHAANGQSSADWSALYGQFSLSHTIAYLPNHFDRGATSASLVSITTKRDVKCLVFLDRSYGDVTLSSSDKAQLLRDSIVTNMGKGKLNDDKPLLQSIGEDLNMFIAVIDAEEVECAFPHCMMNYDYFSYQTHATFVAGSGGMLVSGVTIQNNDSSEEIQLSKAEKSDISLLTALIEKRTACKTCTWLDE